MNILEVEQFWMVSSSRAWGWGWWKIVEIELSRLRNCGRAVHVIEVSQENNRTERDAKDSDENRVTEERSGSGK